MLQLMQAMASADETTCLKALELLRHTAGRLTLVRIQGHVQVC